MRAWAIFNKMKTYFKTVDEMIEKGEDSPLPMSVIPNNMGINLCSVDAISWQKQDDGQLTNLTIYFIPATPNEIKEQGGEE